MKPQRPALEVADIFREHGLAYRLTRPLSPEQRRVMQAIEQCRTAALGGHVQQCDACAYQQIAYNSCRNRHCPKCQSLARARWLKARLADLLPVEYFHVVFTLPEPLAPLALQNQRLVYNLLFATAARTLQTIAADPKHLGAELGFLAVLHTWSQTLRHHPHLHCVIPGGGLAPDQQRWLSCRPGFFLPVKVLSRLFRRLFLSALARAFTQQQLKCYGSLLHLAQPAAFQHFLNSLRRREWIVYAKPPFGGPAQVLAYLGRYTHRVAISNQRLHSCKNGQVTFSWKDYRSQQTSLMTLNAEEFIRRFLLHVLPRGFQRLRQFGFLCNRQRRHKLARCRELLATASPPQLNDCLYSQPNTTAASWLQCPVCQLGTMRLTTRLLPPPPLPNQAFWQATSTPACQIFDSS